MGDDIDLMGLNLTGTYNDGTERDIPMDQVQVSGFDSSQPALEQIIKLTVGTWTFEYRIQIEPQSNVQVLSGSDRYGTAARISQAMYQTAETVVLVRSDDFPDALAAGPLAHALNAPILLTLPTRLNETTLQELNRLEAKKIILLGGTNAISTSVEEELQKLYEVERIQGSNRYLTALRIAERLKELNGEPDALFLTAGLNFADALSAGSYAAMKGMPLLLTNGKTVTAENVNFMLGNGISNVTIMGGTNAISETVDDQLKANGITVSRIYGERRDDTAAAMAQTYFKDARYAIAANGLNYVDALSAIPYAAKLQAPILLVRNTTVAESITTFLKGSSIHTVYVVGGNAVVSGPVRTLLLLAIQ